MSWRLATTTRNSLGASLMALLDVGGAGRLHIYTGTQPSDPDDTATGTLLASLTFSEPAWGSFVAGVGSAEAIASGGIVATGTAGYGRLVDGNGNTHSNMDVGMGTGTINFDDTNFIQGGTASVSSASITIPVE